MVDWHPDVGPLLIYLIKELNKELKSVLHTFKEGDSVTFFHNIEYFSKF